MKKTTMRRRERIGGGGDDEDVWHAYNEDRWTYCLLWLIVAYRRCELLNVMRDTTMVEVRVDIDWLIDWLKCLTMMYNV